jgi:aromatic ring-opening dioxygenase catalytic subunit (LigB family)
MTNDATNAATNAAKKGATRREALAAAMSGAAALAACARVAPSSEEPSGKETRAMTSSTSTKRMPVVYVPHGGGPWPFVETGFGSKNELDGLATYLRAVAAVPATRPKALLVVSAHWEESVPTVMNGASPPMLYDYYGFPPASYSIKWPAPGHPAVAARVRSLLDGAGIANAANADRGFDHGTFVPLKLAYPEADVPTVQLSLKRGLDPAEHLAIGRALAPLRDEGVFLVGSGMTFHNLRAFGDPASRPVSEAFDAWLQASMVLDSAARDRRLIEWASAPSGRRAHPREEHLLPLMVIAGAAGADRGVVDYDGKVMGLQLSGYRFG